MDLSKKITSTEKPSTKRGGGRKEGSEWAEFAQAVLDQTPGEWVTYEDLKDTKEALRYGFRLRDKKSFEEGKAFSPLAGKVQFTLHSVTKNEKGKPATGTLSICLLPQTAKKAPRKPAAKKS